MRPHLTAGIRGVERGGVSAGRDLLTGAHRAAPLELVRPVPAIQALSGAAAMGAGIGLQLRGTCGVPPWTVLLGALATRLGTTPGTALLVVNITLLAVWVPLRVQPGIGTIIAAVVPALVCDLVWAGARTPVGLGARVGVLAAGTLILAAGTAVQISAGCGPGVRDGLMTGLAARTGRPIWRVRLAIEIAVLAIGLLFAGTRAAIDHGWLGVGTLLATAAIGPLIGVLLPLATRITNPGGADLSGDTHA